MAGAGCPPLPYPHAPAHPHLHCLNMPGQTFLNRIILIHTAGIPYLEIPLGQSLHLDDPGREIPLRELILFFYQPQDEWMAKFFPSPDLRLIYEVCAGNETYMLAVTAEGTRTRFRLIRSGYDREWWTDAQGAVLPEEKTLALCKRLKLDYSEAFSAAAYTHIAYGKGEGKYARYALFPGAAPSSLALLAEGRFFENTTPEDLAGRFRELGVASGISVAGLRDKVQETSHTWEALAALRQRPALLSEAQALIRRLAQVREQKRETGAGLQASLPVARIQLSELLARLGAAASPPETAEALRQQLREEQIRLQAARPEPEVLLQFELQAREALLREPELQRQVQEIRDKMARLETEKERTLAGLKQQSEARQEALRQEITLLQQSSKNRDSGKPLHAWLEDRYPDWQETIGKVLRDEVLMHPYLNPQIDRINDLIFGLRLDLTDIPVPQRQYEAAQPDKKQKENLLAQRQKELVAAREEGEKEIAACEKRFRAKMQEENRHLVQVQHALDQSRLQARRFEAERAAYIRNFRQQAESDVLRIGYQLQALAQAPETAKGKRTSPAKAAESKAALEAEAQAFAETLAEAESLCAGQAPGTAPALRQERSLALQLADYKALIQEEKDLGDCVAERTRSLALLLPPGDPLSEAIAARAWEQLSEEALRSREEDAGEQLGGLIRELSAMAGALGTGEEIQALCQRINEELESMDAGCRVQLRENRSHLAELLHEIRLFQQTQGELLTGPTLFHPAGAAEAQRKALEWVSALADELDICSLSQVGSGDMFAWEISPAGRASQWLCSAALLAVWLKDQAGFCRIHLLLPAHEPVLFSPKIKKGEEEARIFISSNLLSDIPGGFRYYQKSRLQEQVRTLVWQERL
ncbi:MAG: ATP-binding protein [Bacteroidetes bacterium]|nr:MAG: ATP-binding protein [Bacteroidota bacterium]